MRYYLNIRNGDALIADLDGADYPSLDEARREAILSARELLSEMVRRGEVVNGRSIEICDEEGRILETIRFENNFVCHKLASNSIVRRDIFLVSSSSSLRTFPHRTANIANLLENSLWKRTCKASARE